MDLSDLMLLIYDAKISVSVEGDDLSVRAEKGVITSEILQSIKNNKVEIVRYLNWQKLGGQRFEAVGRDQPLCLSYSQRRIWLLDQIEGPSAQYNMPGALQLTGVLNKLALDQAFSAIFARHECLRTSFKLGDDGQPIQVISAHSPFVVGVTDLSEINEAERELNLSLLVVEEASKVFDLSKDLMLRAHLVKTTATDYILLVTMHHIASDGWSMSILTDELCVLYRSFAEGKGNPLPALKLQYADYAAWQRGWLQGELLERQLTYWVSQLAGLPAVHSLPLDHSRPRISSFRGGVYTSRIEAVSSQRLNEFCRDRDATLFMGLHAVFSLLIARHSNETDIVLACPIANREQLEVEHLIGFFANTLVLRSDLSGSQCFESLLAQSKDLLLKAYAYQQVPFDLVVERLQPERNLNHSPLFQIMLVLHNNKKVTVELPDLVISSLEETGSGIAKFDLTLNVNEDEEGIHLTWEYSSDLFDCATIARMATHFDLLLKNLLRAPDDDAFRLDMLCSEERVKLLQEFNHGAFARPKYKCINEIFEEQVGAAPEAIAIIFEGQQFTYREINSKANQLAHYLIVDKQVKPNDIVGLCVECPLGAVTAILAILKTGSAYLPLEPALPLKRKADILSDSGKVLLLTESALSDELMQLSCPLVVLDSLLVTNDVANYPCDLPLIGELGGESLAYAISTSGSTGRPKLIAMPHRALINLIEAIVKRDPLPCGACTIVQFSSIGFDMSFTEIFLAFKTRGILVLIDRSTKGAVDKFVQVVVSNRVNVLNLPYTMLKILCEFCVKNSVRLTHLRCIFSSAEQLKITPEIRDFFMRNPDCRLTNHYGPSETHVVTSTVMPVTVKNWPAVPSIGRPIYNVNCYILDSCKQLVPQGVIGHLYVSGPCLAIGYINQDALTSERFIENPYNSAQNAVMYQTGDLARWTQLGEIEYIGRIDQQVKIRGYRVELGEVESVIREHPKVRDILVLAKISNLFDGKYLLAYVVIDAVGWSIEAGSAEEAKLIEDLREYVGLRLPDYMVPSVFEVIDNLPLTTNGKVDIGALPEPDVTRQQKKYVAPRTALECMLCEIWQSVLGVERVGVYDNFFQLGGHSLFALKVTIEINSVSDVKVSVGAIFNCPVLLELANLIESLRLQNSISIQAPDDNNSFCGIL